MKLFDLAMKLERPDIRVLLIDSKSRRIAFEGMADQLLDYSGIDYRKVVRIDIKDGSLYIDIN